MADKLPMYLLDTFAERRKARLAADKKAEPKQVDKDADEVEDKAVTSSQTKKRPARKKS